MRAQIALLLLPALALAPACASEPPELSELLSEGHRVTTVEGETVPLSSLLSADRPTVIEFWATWCSPCLKTMPALQELHVRYSAGGLQVIGLTVEDPGTDLQRVIDTAAARGVAYPLAFAPNDLFKRATGRNVVAVPKTIVYDPGGRVAAYFQTYSIFTKGKIGRSVERIMWAATTPDVGKR